MFKNRRPADTVPKFPSRLRRSRRNKRYAVRTEEEAHVRRQKYADIPFFRSAIKQFRCSSFQSRVVQKQQKRSAFPERGVFGSARREKITASRRTADLRGNDCPPCMGFLKGWRNPRRLRSDSRWRQSDPAFSVREVPAVGGSRYPASAYNADNPGHAHNPSAGSPWTAPRRCNNAYRQIQKLYLILSCFRGSLRANRSPRGNGFPMSTGLRF